MKKPICEDMATTAKREKMNSVFFGDIDVITCNKCFAHIDIDSQYKRSCPHCHRLFLIIKEA